MEETRQESIGTALMPTPPERHIRVLRLVEYAGPESIVRAQVAGSIHGTRYYQSGGCVRITAVTIDMGEDVGTALNSARRMADSKLADELQSRLDQCEHKLSEEHMLADHLMNELEALRHPPKSKAGLQKAR
jgi:hypothetical protein